MTRPFTIFSIILHAMLASSVLADDVDPLAAAAANFRCGDPANATVIPSSSGNFTSVVVGAQCEGHGCGSFLVPQAMFWHIYPLPAGSTPRHAMHPEGLLQAQVRNGVLSYQLQDVLEGYYKGEPLLAGISLYIPTDQLKSVAMEGVEQYLQVHADKDETLSAGAEPLRVTNGAIDSQVRLSSPYWSVDYHESGVDNEVWMDVAEGSSVDFSGVDIDAHIKTPGGLSLRSSGVDNDIFVEGKVRSGTLDGVDANLRINDSSSTDPCANITKTGVGNGCKDTDDLFAMEDLACLADTKTVYQCDWSWNMSTAATITMGVVLFILFAAAVSGCIYCCARGCCCGSKGRELVTPAPAPYPPTTTVPKEVQNDTFKGSEDNAVPDTVMEAEVLEVKSATAEPGQFEEIDLEKNKDPRLTPYVY